MFPKYKLCLEKCVEAIHVTVAQPAMRTAFLTVLNILFVPVEIEDKKVLCPCVWAITLWSYSFLLASSDSLYGNTGN